MRQTDFGVTGVLSESDDEVSAEEVKSILKENEYPELPVIWGTVYKHMISHTISLYALYLVFTSAKLLTIGLLVVNYLIGTLGSTAGVHRLWSHRSYKAKWPLRLFLAYAQTSNFHMDIVFWVKYHRIHHKYTETDLDPHNVKRGFVFSHIGWTFRESSPDFLAKYNSWDVSDLHADPIVRYQEKYYQILMPLICYIIPSLIPWYFWNETFINAFCVNMLRYVLNLHTFFCVNSVTHTFGTKPYDKSLEATENMWVSAFIGGEGWHNFHHVFPWDYTASETDWLNISTTFINYMEKLGLAYDLKKVSKEMIERRIKRTGDGSHPMWEKINAQ